MASPPVVTPSGTTGLNIEAWLPTVEAPTFQGTEFINSIREFPGKMLNLAHVRKFARMLGSTLAQSADGNGLTPLDPTATPVTWSPVGRQLQCAWSANEKAQIDLDLGGGLARVMEDGMSETLDSAGLAAVTSLTQTMSQSNPDASQWRQAVGRLMTNTNGQYGPGRPGEIKAIFATTQYPAVMGIDEFTHADARGDSESPLVKGIFLKGGGINARFSTVVTSDANGWHCPLYVEDTFMIGWNQRTVGYSEQVELLFRITLYANMGVSVIHDLRGIDMRFTASALG